MFFWLFLFFLMCRSSRYVLSSPGGGRGFFATFRLFRWQYYHNQHCSAQVSSIYRHKPIKDQKDYMRGPSDL